MRLLDDVDVLDIIDAGGGGTLALNIPNNWDQPRKKGDWRAGAYGWLARAREEQGWLISTVATLPDLLGFARAFSRRHYGSEKT